MSASRVDVIVAGISGVDHETVDELHGLGPLSSKLAGHDDLAALGSRLHDEAEDTVAGTSDGQATDELVPHALGLGDGAETAGGDLLGVELDRSLGEVEPLLDDGGELANPAALLSEHVLGAGGHDNDLGPGGRHTDLDTGVAILGQLTSEELVQLGLEHAVGDELEARASVIDIGTTPTDL